MTKIRPEFIVTNLVELINRDFPLICILLFYSGVWCKFCNPLSLPLWRKWSRTENCFCFAWQPWQCVPAGPLLMATLPHCTGKPRFCTAWTENDGCECGALPAQCNCRQVNTALFLILFNRLTFATRGIFLKWIKIYLPLYLFTFIYLHFYSSWCACVRVCVCVWERERERERERQCYLFLWGKTLLRGSSCKFFIFALQFGGRLFSKTPCFY